MNGVELTVFWITIFFVCRRESIKKAKESQKRVRGYLISNLWKEIMLVGLVLVFSKEQNLEMIASEIDVRNDFLLIPFLIGYWVYILKKIIAICIWNYDWEKTYANELKEKESHPILKHVPFPKLIRRRMEYGKKIHLHCIVYFYRNLRNCRLLLYLQFYIYPSIYDIFNF